jgi:hypothetical protein
MIPAWLHVAGVAWLAASALSALVIAGDELAGHPQQMWIMDVVWPITALWAGPIALVAYYTIGRTSTRRAVMAAKARGATPPNKAKPFWQSVAVGATHCGAGCSLADLIVEWAVLAVPVTLFGERVFGTWVVDFIVAFATGIVFQYFTIAPMRGLSLGKGIVAAVKADTLSLTAWQLGMYGWMALALFVWFSPAQLPKTGTDFWFLMQLAMMAGFVTSYPVNWWLLRAGLKETM